MILMMIHVIIIYVYTRLNARRKMYNQCRLLFAHFKVTVTQEKTWLFIFKFQIQQDRLQKQVIDVFQWSEE